VVKIDPRTGEADVNAVWQQMLDSVSANAWWMVPYYLWLIYSGAVILVLVLDPARPPLSTAMARALRILPGLTLAYLLASLLVFAGAGLFLVPGLYLYGRTFLTQPILFAEPRTGPLGALVASIQRSRGRGWMLFFIPIGLLLLEIAAGNAVGLFGDTPVQPVSAPVHFVLSALQAAITAASALAQALLLAAAYRAIAGARQGI
jgi:hypothetical protein